jgi:hypothetical protein
LRRFCEILQERATTAAHHEIESYQQGLQTDEQYETNKVRIYQGFNLRVSITGANNQSLFGAISEVFNSPNFPDEVKSIYVYSNLVLKTQYNYVPRNSFEVFLDFSRPAVFDFSIFPSQPTPNGSRIIIEGLEATWANGLFHELQNFGSSGIPVKTGHRLEVGLIFPMV